ncbi:unnamed protein product [Owenia fusiformis]|nr:unnamed protein product [Owenia fusiformis]
MDFKVINCDDKSFSFTCLLHTYFGVPDVRKCKISGLQELTYVDKVASGERFSEAKEQVTISENVDRVYEKTPAYWEHLVTAVNGGYCISLQKHNMPDTVVWNPWIEKAKAMTDFGDDEYLKMLCVEAGYVSEPFTLKAGEIYEGTQVLIALPASDSSL